MDQIPGNARYSEQLRESIANAADRFIANAERARNTSLNLPGVFRDAFPKVRATVNWVELVVAATSIVLLYRWMHRNDENV